MIVLISTLPLNQRNTEFYLRLDKDEQWYAVESNATQR